MLEVTSRYSPKPNPNPPTSNSKPLALALTLNPGASHGTLALTQTLTPTRGPI